MHVFGRESIKPLLHEKSYLFKITVNDHGLILFPRETEHEEISEEDIHYVPDSKGNAIAGIVKPGHIEFRHHNDFSDERVHLLMERILALPEMAFARGFEVTYQGRVIVARHEEENS
ncbi:hypothetical protein DTL21_21155 [Bremerella cremea]|uniref:Uncharacterized protein n=1 Tax=Blastopirellula marina TaxID=124 RepID=A0A2S8FKM0_9BACT|nr:MULTISPECIES: hypothetical protein [Pirellulaceae]PQO32703.1 hypothetical protein C5Y83_21135 [Blastopirellula marina]RCS45770.1 hypothetical protein DTL21_21155 [Bremerella cremea]